MASVPLRKLRGVVPTVGIVGAQSARNPNCKFLKIRFFSCALKNSLFITNARSSLKGGRRWDNIASPKPMIYFFFIFKSDTVGRCNTWKLPWSLIKLMRRFFSRARPAPLSRAIVSTVATRATFFTFMLKNTVVKFTFASLKPETR